MGSTITSRSWQVFKANRRGYISFWILLTLFALSAFAEGIANDRPIIVKYDGHYLFPMVKTYIEKDTFGGQLESEADYADPWVIAQIEQHGWTHVHTHYNIGFGICAAAGVDFIGDRHYPWRVSGLFRWLA